MGGFVLFFTLGPVKKKTYVFIKKMCYLNAYIFAYDKSVFV